MPTNNVVEEYLHPIDVRDAHVLTRVVDRKVPETDHYNVPFVPMRNFRGRKVKLRVKEANGAGLAGLKADNANTPIVSGGGVLQEIYLDLVTISEKDVLNATDILALDSPDMNVAREAARTVVDKTANLRLRNINRTLWMAWEAVKDNLSLVYPNGSVIQVDWDLDGDSWNDWFSGSHLPEAEADWDHQDSNEAYDTNFLEEFYAWTKLIGDDLGCDPSECILHINTTTWRYIRRNKWLIRDSNPSLPQPRTAPLKTAELADLLDIAAVKVLNPYYLEDDGDARRTKNYMLPDHYALVTGPYTYKGKPLAEMYDGLVATVSGEDISVAPNPGMRAEIYINKEQVAKNVRVTTARMPVLNYPAGFLYANLKPSLT